MRNGPKVALRTVLIGAECAKPVVVAHPVGIPRISRTIILFGAACQDGSSLIGLEREYTMTDFVKPGGSGRKPSYTIMPTDVPLIKKRIREGDFLNRIAADYDVNPGRISEIKTGLRYADIAAAP